MLRKYLPTDLEDRIRERLNQSGIDALDETEATVSVLAPSRPGGLAPVDIRRARKAAGWTQAELARRLGVDRSLLARWESAAKPIPVEREARIIELLRVHLPRTSVGLVTAESPKDLRV